MSWVSFRASEGHSCRFLPQSSIAAYAEVQKSKTTLGGVGVNIIRCVSTVPVSCSLGSTPHEVLNPPYQP